MNQYTAPPNNDCKILMKDYQQSFSVQLFDLAQVEIRERELYKIGGRDKNNSVTKLMEISQMQIIIKRRSAILKELDTQIYLHYLGQFAEVEIK